MNDLIDTLMDITDPRTPVRQSWPTCGTSGTPDAAKLARYQAHDPSGRVWVAVTYYPVLYSDQTENWFGPVVSEDAEVICLDLGTRWPVAFLTRYAHIRRTA
jgi:hypothetical protein